MAGVQISIMIIKQLPHAGTFGVLRYAKEAGILSM